jgi:hypothetical protein
LPEGEANNFCRSLIWNKKQAGLLRSPVPVGVHRKGAAFCRGVDMTGETVKMLLLLLMFGGLDTMRVQPAVLKRRSQGRRLPR